MNNGQSPMLLSSKLVFFRFIEIKFNNTYLLAINTRIDSS